MEMIYDKAVGSYLSDYMGHIFEKMCKQYLLRHMNSLPFVFSEIGTWWGTHSGLKKEVELDIVAVGAKENNTIGREYLIGSCKYTSNEIGINELELIREYSSAFATNNDTCYYYIFSKAGFTQSLKEAAERKEVILVSLDDLYMN